MTEKNLTTSVIMLFFSHTKYPKEIQKFSSYFEQMTVMSQRKQKPRMTLLQLQNQHHYS